MGETDSRPRGILTQADRKYLRGEKELSGQTERNTRRRIRNRALNALHDFSILWSFLEEDDLELLFELDSEEDRDIRTSVQDMIAFGILGLWKNDDYYPQRVEQAIQQAAYARNRRAEVDLRIEEELMESSNDILRRVIDSELQNTTYEEWERAIMDPDADPELVAKSYNMFQSEEEVTVEDIEEIQEVYREAPTVRPTPPQIVKTEPIFSDMESVE